MKTPTEQFLVVLVLFAISCQGSPSSNDLSLRNEKPPVPDEAIVQGEVPTQLEVAFSQLTLQTPSINIFRSYSDCVWENGFEIDQLTSDEWSLLQSEIVKDYDRLTAQWLDQERIRLMSTPNNLEGLLELSKWFREVRAEIVDPQYGIDERKNDWNYQAFSFESALYRIANYRIEDITKALQAKVNKQLAASYDELEMRFLACESFEQIENLKNMFLSFPVKSSSSTGRDLVAIIKSQEDELEWKGRQQYFSSRELRWMLPTRQVDASRGAGLAPTEDEIALALLREYLELDGGRWIGPRTVECKAPMVGMLEAMVGREVYVSIRIEPTQVRRVKSAGEKDKYTFQVKPKYGGDLSRLSGLGAVGSSWATVTMSVVLTLDGWRASDFLGDLKDQEAGLDWIWRNYRGIGD